MAAEFLLPVRVYIEDTDAGGIVYYVNYLKFFERARTEMLRTLGQSKAAVSDDGLMYVVTEAAIKYHQPARLDDALAVGAALTDVGAATMTFAQSVRRGADVLAVGRVGIACVDRHSGKPLRLAAPLRAVLQQHLVVDAAQATGKESG